MYLDQPDEQSGIGLMIRLWSEAAMREQHRELEQEIQTWLKMGYELEEIKIIVRHHVGGERQQPHVEPNTLHSPTTRPA